MEIAFREYVELTGMIEGVYHEAALKLKLTDSFHQMGICC